MIGGNGGSSADLRENRGILGRGWMKLDPLVRIYLRDQNE